MDAVFAELRIWADAAAILAPIVAVHAAWWGLVMAVSVWRGWDPGNVSGVWAGGGLVVAAAGLAAGSMPVFGCGLAAAVTTAAWPLTILYHYAGLWAWRGAARLVRRLRPTHARAVGHQ